MHSFYFIFVSAPAAFSFGRYFFVVLVVVLVFFYEVPQLQKLMASAAEVPVAEASLS